MGVEPKAQELPKKAPKVNEQPPNYEILETEPAEATGLIGKVDPKKPAGKLEEEEEYYYDEEDDDV